MDKLVGSRWHDSIWIIEKNQNFQMWFLPSLVRRSLGTNLVTLAFSPQEGKQAVFKVHLDSS